MNSCILTVCYQIFIVTTPIIASKQVKGFNTLKKKKDHVFFLLQKKDRVVNISWFYNLGKNKITTI